MDKRQRALWIEGVGMRVIRVEKGDHRPGNYQGELFEIRSRTAARLGTTVLRPRAGVALVARRALAGNDMEQFADFSIADVIRGPDPGIQRCYLVPHAERQATLLPCSGARKWTSTPLTIPPMTTQPKPITIHTYRALRHGADSTRCCKC